MPLRSSSKTRATRQRPVRISLSNFHILIAFIHAIGNQMKFNDCCARASSPPLLTARWSTFSILFLSGWFLDFRQFSHWFHVLPYKSQQFIHSTRQYLHTVLRLCIYAVSIVAPSVDFAVNFCPPIFFLLFLLNIWKSKRRQGFLFFYNTKEWMRKQRREKKEQNY